MIKRALAWAFVAVLIGGLGLSAAARASDPTDYGFGEHGWNGLSQLLVVAAETGVDLRAPARIDLGELQARDGLLVVYPERSLPRADLAAFMYEGGRLAIADDFGAGSELLHGFHIARSAPPKIEAAQRLRGNASLAIALPRVRHPLAEDVAALVTNHPQALHHGELDAIFSLRENGAGAVVLAGAVGQGRLVAIGDSSVLINNMLEFRGNRAFARNLVRYLAGGGRLWLAGPETVFTNHYGSAAAADPLARLREGLRRLAQVRLPEPALRALAAVIALLLLAYAVSALPRRSSLLRAVSLPVVETRAGFAGRVQFFTAQGRDLLPPLLVYKAEFETRLALALGFLERQELFQIEGALRAAGHPDPLVLDTRSVWLELAAHALPGAAPVPPGKFHALVAAGDRILAALQREQSQKT